MITYNDIYEAARKERYSEQLQQIPKNFILEFSKYIKEKREIVNKENEELSDIVIKTKKQLENATTLFKELIIRRRKKILNLVLIAAETGISKQDFENMLAMEKELFEGLMRCMDSSEKKLNESLTGNGKGELVKSNDLVVFLEDVEEFLGADEEKMGPYKKGDIVNLPKEISKILFDGKKIEILEK